MAEENKDEESTSETSEDENKEEDVSTDETDENKESEDNSLKIDYEAELTKERERREEAERRLQETRRKAKDRFEKRHQKEESEEDEETPLTGSELRAILAEEREETRKEFMASQIEEKAKKLATSDSEARLIVEIHKNRKFPSNLSIDDQLEEAYAIANRKRILAQNEELKRALRSKETRNKSGGGDGSDSTLVPSEPKMASADIAAMKASGWVWDAQKRLYKKPIGGNKFRYKNPKTKEMFTAS